MAGSSQSSAASAANEALTDNPSILNSPSLARDAINSPNPSESAMTLAHVSQVSALQEHLSKKSVFGASEEVWQKMFNKQAKIVAGGLNWIGKGLEETKRDYRFIHSVYTKQGIFDGLVATGLVAGGAFLGSSMGPGGTALGATLVATALRKGEGGTIYKESLKDSEDPNYKVSAGRDLSNLISLIPGAESFAKTDKGLGKLTSGLGDVGFTFATDPFIKVLQLRSAVRSGDYLIKGKLIKATNLAKKMLPPTAVDNFFQRNSLRITSTDQLEKLYQSGKGSILTRNPLDTLIGSAGSQYHRGLNELADIANSPNGVGAIVSKYPGLQNMAKIIAPAAGKKVTAEDIHKLFLRTTFDKDFQALNATSGINVVPNRTVLRAAVSKFSDSLKQSGGVNDALYLKANQPGFLIPRRGQQMVIDPITGGSIPDGKGVSAITPVAYRAIQSINPFSKQSFKDVGESMKAAVAVHRDCQ